MSTEAKCPFTSHRRRRQDEPRLVAEPAAAGAAAPAFLEVRPDGQRLRLREGVQEPRLQGAEEGPGQADDRLAGLVAGGLRPLRPVLHPHGLARRRHLPHHRRARRRRPRPAALRAPRQLARQRQPRQGAPPAVADQAEVRPEDLLGRPADPRRQRGARVDGLQDLRLRRRPRGRVGAGRGRELGRGDRRGWATTSASPAIGIWGPSAPPTWASSTSTRRARTRAATTWPPPRTSAPPSAAWR